MAVTAKDGSRHHSASRASLHDELSSKKGNATVTPMKKPDGTEDAMTHPTPSTHSIEDHVEEHGPAYKIDYHHDHLSGQHHVSSHHGEPPASSAEAGRGQTHGGMSAVGGGEPEGGSEKSHHSVHKTLHAAHEHMGKSMGLDHRNEERPAEAADETPDSSQDQTAGSRGIPGIAS